MDGSVPIQAEAASAPEDARNSRWAAIRRLLQDWVAAESARLGLWAPVAMGGGVVLYFSLTVEPQTWVAPLIVVALFILHFRLGPVARVLAAAAALAALGFWLADWRTAMVRAPIIENGLGPRMVVGRIVSVEEEQGSRRAVIAVRAVAGVAAPPARVRVTWRGAAFDAEPGDLVRFRAVLRAPPPPEAPGGFDYARLLYFERIGGLGFALTPPRRLAEARMPAGDAWLAILERARLSVTRRILTVAPSQGGALVAASVTGDRAAITDETDQALRESGLAHLIAISGLNMALATGIVFFALRALLAAIAPLALRYPIKKWAAFAALGTGLVYLALSGGAASAVRAFIMAAIVFVAILFDRRALTLRNVAVAATIILVLTPEAATQPGFQMSFAAVTALVAAFEWWKGKFKADRDEGPILRLRRYVLGLAATDIVASSATGPFSLFHFGRAALFGLPANMLAGPLVAFLLMPFAVLGMILLPFGLDGFAFRIAAAAGDGVVAIGAWIAALPHGVVSVPQGPPFALGLATLGGLWLCLAIRPWRLAGAPVLAAGALLLATAAPPDILVSSDGKAAGVFLKERRALALTEPQRRAFLARVWKEQLGLDPERAPTLALENSARCILGVCRLEIDGVAVAIAKTPEGAARACSSADLVLAISPAPEGLECAARLWRAGEAGAAAIFVDKGRITIKSSVETSGARPWTAR